MGDCGTCGNNWFNSPQDLSSNCVNKKCHSIIGSTTELLMTRLIRNIFYESKFSNPASWLWFLNSMRILSQWPSIKLCSKDGSAVCCLLSDKNAKEIETVAPIKLDSWGQNPVMIFWAPSNQHGLRVVNYQRSFGFFRKIDGHILSICAIC